MRAPTAHEILSVWEAGVRRHPIDRAVLLLWLACPDLDEESMWSMKIGERNRLLLDWYSQFVGSQLDCFTRCHHCKTDNEFTVPIHQIRFDALPPREEPFQVDGFTVRFQQPTSRELAAASRETGLVSARRLLIEKCIHIEEKEGSSKQISELPESVISAISDALREEDPQADLHLEIVCVNCHQKSAALFDIVTFAWNELTHWAQRLLQEVHRLASAYGWHEAEILSMTPQRRRSYLELVGE